MKLYHYRHVGKGCSKAEQILELHGDRPVRAPLTGREEELAGAGSRPRPPPSEGFTPPPPSTKLQAPPDKTGPVGPDALPKNLSGRPCSTPCLWPIVARSPSGSFARAASWTWSPSPSIRTWIGCHRMFWRPTRRFGSGRRRHRRATSAESISSRWPGVRGRVPSTPAMGSSLNGPRSLGR